MNIDLSAKIHNRFDIEVVDAETGKVKQRAQAFNVVCNSYYSWILGGNYARMLNGVQYGSGTGTPSASDVSLFTYSGYKAAESTSLSYSSSDHTARLLITCTLGVSDAVGVTLTEVGLANQSGNGNIKTHALLQDMNGNPISILKTNTDIINISASVFVHIQSSYNGAQMDFSYTTVDPVGFDCGILQWITGIGNRYRGSEHGNPTLLPPIRFASLRRSNDFPSRQSETASLFSCSFSGNASGKKVTISGRADQNTCNIDGGAKYIQLLTFGNVGNTAHRAVMIPVGEGHDIEGYTVTGESVGTGDGSRTAFTLKFDCASALTVYLNGAATTAYTRSGRTITFNSAPAVGAVVTADYFSDTVPKDADHVFDLTVTMQFGEYTPE